MFQAPEMAFEDLEHDNDLGGFEDYRMNGHELENGDHGGIDDGDDGDDDDDDDEVSEGYRGVFFALTDCCLQFWYCFTSDEKYRQEMKRRRTTGRDSDGAPTVNSVSRIDKASRIMFPLIFTVLNLLYWFFYIIERNAEFYQFE